MDGRFVKGKIFGSVFVWFRRAQPNPHDLEINDRAKRIRNLTLGF
jgi:hypothetical protein